MLDIVQATIDLLSESLPLVFGLVTFSFIITFILLRKRNNDTGELNFLNAVHSTGLGEDDRFTVRD